MPTLGIRPRQIPKARSPSLFGGLGIRKSRLNSIHAFKRSYNPPPRIRVVADRFGSRARSRQAEDFAMVIILGSEQQLRNSCRGLDFSLVFRHSTDPSK